MTDEKKPETPALSVVPTPPVVSPTGAPVLPPKVVPYALYVATVAIAIDMAPDLGITIFPVAVISGAKFVTLLATLFGIVSPGQRRIGQ